MTFVPYESCELPIRLTLRKLRAVLCHAQDARDTNTSLDNDVLLWRCSDVLLLTRSQY